MAVDTVRMEVAREFLDRVRELQRTIDSKGQRIETLRDMATSTTGRMSDMPRSDSPDLQRMETALCKAADLEIEIAEDLAALEKAKEEITAAICELGDYREQQVLFARYVECQSWAAIACECGYHYRTIMKQHRAGLAHLAAQMAEK